MDTNEMGSVLVDQVRGRVAEIFPGVVSDLEALVRIPSVSNPEFDQGQVEASAAAVAALFAGEGMSVDILRVDGGRPAVVARRPAPPGAPTVLLYGHHDVQPAAEGWGTDPFEPVRIGDRLYGRGAADDKAGVVAHLGAVRALGDAPVGVTVFIEGEEEIGSPTFTSFLHTHRDLLRSEVMVVADSSNWTVGTPSLTTSLRGLVDLVVEVSVTDRPVHSGMFGGPLLDAVTVLARLVATLHDEHGNVAVPGLVEAPDPVVDYDPEQFRADAGMLDGVRTVGSGPLTAHLWTRPALAVIGMDVPPVATASNVIIPSARAKLSMRLAPGQDPAAAQTALTDHLMRNAPFGARVVVHPGEQGRPYGAPSGTEVTDLARAALAAAWQTVPVDIGQGGSIPFVAELAEVFPDAAILVTGVEDPESSAHGPDESVHLGELERVVVAETLLLHALGARAGS